MTSTGIEHATFQLAAREYHVSILIAKCSLLEVKSKQGSNVTLKFCMNATGQFISPLLIPKEKIKQRLMLKGLPEAAAVDIFELTFFLLS
jgi:hypothetical protein